MPPVAVSEDDFCDQESGTAYLRTLPTYAECMKQKIQSKYPMTYNEHQNPIDIFKILFEDFCRKVTEYTNSAFDEQPISIVEMQLFTATLLVKQVVTLTPQDSWDILHTITSSYNLGCMQRHRWSQILHSLRAYSTQGRTPTSTFGTFDRVVNKFDKVAAYKATREVCLPNNISFVVDDELKAGKEGRVPDKPKKKLLDLAQKY